MTPDDHQIAALILGAIDAAILGFVAYGLWRRSKLRGATPSSCGTARPGYVRLQGEAQPFAELLQAGSGARAVWFHSTWSVPSATGRRKDAGGRQQRSKAPFFLVDPTGRVLIDPAALEVTTADTIGGRLTIAPQLDTEPRLYAERLIAPGDSIVAVGELHVESASVEKKVAELLREWKADTESLHQRFDLNRDGKIDPAEWEAARAAARAAAEASLKGQGPLRVLSKPRDGRPFLASPVFAGGVEGATSLVFPVAAAAVFFIATVWQALLAR